MRGLGLRCAMVVPLTARGRTFGALTLIGAETHPRYDRRTCSSPRRSRIERRWRSIRLGRFAAESEARAAAVELARRNEVLKDVTAAFGRAASVPEVLAAMLELGVRTAGAAGATVGIVEDGGRVDVAGLSGVRARRSALLEHVRAQRSAADVGRDPRPAAGRPVDHRGARSPVPALRGRGEQRDHALVCLPLLLGDVAIGAFSASYPPGTDFGPEDLSFLRAIGEQCAQAIDRARSRERAARARLRFDALATASRTLALTLDYEETARSAVRLAVDHLGAEATLFVSEREGLTAIAHMAAATSAPEASSESLERAARPRPSKASPCPSPASRSRCRSRSPAPTSGALAVGAPSIERWRTRTTSRSRGR